MPFFFKKKSQPDFYHTLNEIHRVFLKYKLKQIEMNYSINTQIKLPVDEIGKVVYDSIDSYTMEWLEQESEREVVTKIDNKLTLKLNMQFFNTYDEDVQAPDSPTLIGRSISISEMYLEYNGACDDVELMNENEVVDSIEKFFIV